MKNPSPRHVELRDLPLSGMAACVACALLLMSAPPSRAEHTLSTVVVTAQPDGGATLPSIEAATTRIQSVPGGANVVDAEQYKEGRVSTLDDALKFAPGVFIAPRFGAEEARMSIRGSGLQRTFHMRGIQLLQDGVPLNLADGSVDFQAVEPLSARYVEVYRGANALQFGSTTLGGAVNFASPSGLASPHFGARIEAGSFDYLRAQVYTGGASDTLDWFLSGSQFQQDGYRDHSKQNTQRVSGNLGWQLGDALETRFFVNLVQTDSELPGALTRAEMDSDPRAAAAGNISGRQKRDFDLARLSNLTTVGFDAQRRMEVGAFYSYKSLFHPIHQVLDQESDDYGVNLRYISDAELAGRKNRLVVGISAQAGDLDDDRFANVGGQRGARAAQARQQSRNLTLFAENQHYFIPTTAVIVGLQAVDAKRKLDDYFLANGDNSVDQTYSRVSPKLGVLHELSADVQVYVNASGSYEPPTFGELAGGLNVTPVDAQRATTLEVGSRGSRTQAWGGLRWDLSLYRAEVKDELLILDASTPFAKAVNAGKTIHQGIEAGLEADLGRAWTLRASYMLNDFRFKDDPDYGDNRLAGVPRQVLVGEALYKLDNGIYFGPNVRLASASYVDHANTVQASGYGVIGLKIGQQLGKKMSWFIDGRNLADKTYAGTTNVTARADANGSYYYPGDGRSVYAGVELKY